ncbi:MULTISPECIES: DddA-like double-stranded DNA deaminase toxin [Actinosynnema]|uniref:DddA-like double-stranded DNA deaminase toxin n=1 Tax=Actinosynnema TaxID=40566 RepID=UPI0020A5C4E8|nr:DddA-like double-stranded DNA deaminase toxin [Actinosynnema pretiosum]MCP2099116.1 SCP1.201-like deaminase [Actinosynnema pretiosum]
MPGAALGEVVAALRLVVDRAGEVQSALLVAADSAAEAAALIESAGAGSGQEDVVVASATFREVEHDAARTLGRCLDAAIQAVQRVVDALVGEGGPAMSGAAPAVPAGESEDERVERLRRELPPPVVPKTRTKTHGRWWAPGGRGGSLVSGEEPDAKAVDVALRETGYWPRGVLWVTTHVEMKLAVHMRTANIRHATLVINSVPCAEVLGCKNLIGVLLPAGYSLTVHGTGGYRHTFTGGQEPPW